MKLLIYNIAYGTGSPGSEKKRLITGHRYLRAPLEPFQRISEFMVGEAPDIIGLVEADHGSLRTGRMSHTAALAAELGGYHYLGQAKYGKRSLLLRVPYLKHQSNAILSRSVPTEFNYHFFDNGTKKLVISCKLDGIRVFLHHQALTSATRAKQLAQLAEWLTPGEPSIIAGDFNTFRGAAELERFCKRFDLRSANSPHLPTYPAWKPVKELDYILYSPELELRSFRVPECDFSDHLPLIADFVSCT